MGSLSLQVEGQVYVKSKGLTNAGRFWNTDETPTALMADPWVVSLCVRLGGD